MINISDKTLCPLCFEETSSEPCPACGLSEDSYVCEAQSLPCGSILQERYRIGKLLSRGIAGNTYVAYDTKLERKIAVKEYFPRELVRRSDDCCTVNISDPESEKIFRTGTEKFYNEARIIARLNGNPGIAAIYDFFYENETAYYSMEYISGTTLKEYVNENGVISPDQAVLIAGRISDALEAAHGVNILHREVSPENIFLCDDGNVKLIDFGSARQIIDDSGKSVSIALKLDFAAMEQFRKKGKLGPWSDIYSLGMCLYYGFTGKEPPDPFSRMDIDDDTESKFQADFAYMPKGIRKIVRKAVQMDISERYQNVTEFKKDLDAISEAELSDMKKRFTTLSEDIQTINRFASAMTEAQGLSETMAEVEAIAKQLIGCESAVFYCYDNAAENFFFGGHRNRKDPDQAPELKSAFESGKILTNGKQAVVPLVSARGETVGIIAVEKETGFSFSDFEHFKAGSHIASTVELALNREFEHRGRVTDELTGLKNRQGLNEYVCSNVLSSIIKEEPVNIVMCDIDHFKNVNDTYGHDAGDIVLKNVAEILKNGVNPGLECAFRFGGEEMIVLMNCGHDSAYEAAEIIRKNVENAVHHVTLDGEEKTIKVTISMGVYQMKPETEMTLENARDIFDSELKYADSLLYFAKETGRNQVATFEIYNKYAASEAVEK